MRTKKHDTELTHTEQPQFPDLNEKLLENELSFVPEQENNVKSVSKELFNKSEIDVKTEVTHDEINMITKLRFLEARYRVRNIDLLCSSLLTLRVSKNRKSRREFIDALRTEDENANNQSMLSRLFGKKNG